MKKNPTQIAIIGIETLYPKSLNNKDFWQNIINGVDCIEEVPASHWQKQDFFDPEDKDKLYTCRGGFLPKVDFDPAQFGITPKMLETTDTQQLLSLVVLEKLLNKITCIKRDKVKHENVSVILGSGPTEMLAQMSAKIQQPYWQKALREHGIGEQKIASICQRISSFYPEWDETTFPGLLGNVIAGRISNRFNLGRTNCIVDAACASSFAALNAGIRELQLGLCDLLISGGVDTLNDVVMYMCFCKTGAVSHTQDCRPFSSQADGTMLGEGIGLFALRRLEDAERDGDSIYGVIQGLGSSSDGKGKSVYAPKAAGQALAISRAYEEAGCFVDDMELIEAHGTGTIAGDFEEFAGLQKAFASTNKFSPWCALGSIKSQIGHTKAAAGAASLFKVVMALHHKILPATTKVEKPNPRLDIQNSPFYLNTRNRPWIKKRTEKRKASASSFGFGGTNFHVIVEEYTGTNRHKKQRIFPEYLLFWAANDIKSLCCQLENSRSQLTQKSLSEVAYQSMSKLSDGKHRLAIIAKNKEQLVELLATAQNTVIQSQQKFSIPGKMYYQSTFHQGKWAFLFPGQGSQYLHMGANWALEFNEAMKVWEEAEELNWDKSTLSKLVFPPTTFDEKTKKQQQQQLISTQWAQPAIGVTSASVLALFKQLEITADCVAGHSYGELTALFAAGVFKSLGDFLRISRRRGEFMAQADPGGTMLIVFCTPDTIAQIDLQQVEIVNINSPKQLVLSGKIEDIVQAQQKLQNKHITCKRLSVTAAFHSKYMNPVAETFYKYLQHFSIDSPQIPIYSNSGGIFSSDKVDICQQLSQQISNPVYFQRQIERMYKDGVRGFIELGPKSTLSGLVKEILADKDDISVLTTDSHDTGIHALQITLAQIFCAGKRIAGQKLFSQFTTKREQDQKLSPIATKINGANKKPNIIHQSKKENKMKEQSLPQVSLVKKQSERLPKNNIEQDLPSWLQAFQTLQNNAFESQKHFHDYIAKSHSDFLLLSQVAMQHLEHIALGNSSASLGLNSSKTLLPLSIENKQNQEGKLSEPFQNKSFGSTGASPVVFQAPKNLISPSKEQSEEIQEHIPQSQELSQLLLSAVSDKTGYPIEMLALDTNLESDLGIDSIKRVEILSSLQEKIPFLKENDAAELTSFNTLREILAFITKKKIA